MKYTYYWIIASLLFVVVQTSCRKMITIGPPKTSLNSENIYENDATAISTLTAVFAKMSNTGFGSENPFTGMKSLAVFSGLSSDELRLADIVSEPTFKAYYQNSLGFDGSSATFGSESWKQFYSLIFACNSVLEGLNMSSMITPFSKQQLLGKLNFCERIFISLS